MGLTVLAWCLTHAVMSLLMRAEPVVMSSNLLCRKATAKLLEHLARCESRRLAAAVGHAWLWQVVC